MTWLFITQATLICCWRSLECFLWNSAHKHKLLNLNRISTMKWGLREHSTIKCKSTCIARLLFWKEPANVFRLCSVLNGITQFYLPPTRFIPARTEHGLEHFIRNELVNVASHCTDLGRMEAWVKLSAREWSWTSAVHDWTCIWVSALTNWACQADNKASNGQSMVWGSSHENKLRREHEKHVVCLSSGRPNHTNSQTFKIDCLIDWPTVVFCSMSTPDRSILGHSARGRTNSGGLLISAGLTDMPSMPWRGAPRSVLKQIFITRLAYA